MMVMPVYLAETSPPKIRGRLSIFFTIMMLVGDLAGFLVGVALAPHWRAMFWLGGVPAVIIIVGMPFRPESPMWLIKKNQH